MLKNGQDVEVICGKDKGKKGQIIEILRNKNKAKVKQPWDNPSYRKNRK